MERIEAVVQRVLERENRIWDERQGVDTRGWVVPAPGSTSSGVADGFPYAGTHVRLARAVLDAVRARAPGATFVDLGAGKGRVLMLAAELPFAAVVGVEYSRELHRVAERNLAACRTVNGRELRVELADVREFSFPETPLVVYLNNPFPEHVLAVVLAHLRTTYEQRPRPLAVVYQQLRDEDAEHDTRNVELLGEVEFLAKRPLDPPRLVDRVLLRPYALHAFVAR